MARTRETANVFSQRQLENGLVLDIWCGTDPECAFFVDDDVVVGVVVVVGVCAATHCSESARTQKVRMAERGACR